jgi:hypothetical protein
MAELKMTPEKIAHAQILLNEERKPKYISQQIKVSRQLIHNYIKRGVLTEK